MNSVWRGELDSPLGTLILESDGVALTHIHLPGTVPPRVAALERRDDLPVFVDLAGQLAAYFAGKSVVFDLPLEPGGTPFQREVWTELQRIPAGETITYAELADRVGRPRAHRAVGAANGRNPLPIIVPCHRVIGSDGRLTGFAGGLEAKRRLLRLENAPAATTAP